MTRSAPYGDRVHDRSLRRYLQALAGTDLASGPQGLQEIDAEHGHRLRIERASLKRVLPGGGIAIVVLGNTAVELDAIRGAATLQTPFVLADVLAAIAQGEPVTQ